MNLQEQIEKAWKAGFECAMQNAEPDEDMGVFSLMGDSYLEALNDYINTEALTSDFTAAELAHRIGQTRSASEVFHELDGS